MKKIKVRQISAELDKLGATDGYKSIVLNNVSHYNELVDEHLTTKNLKREYLMYQLSVQIAKLLLDLKKMNKRAGIEPEDTDFMKLLNGMKEDKSQRQKKYEESKAANEKS